MTALALAAVTALTLGACGDDAGDDAGDDDTTTTTEAAAAEPVTVTFVDYGFQGLPDSVPAGTKFSVTNSSTAELHEFVAFKIPDAEKRSVEELMALPEEEGQAALGGPPAAVLLGPPGGGEQIAAVGDGTLADPGRYLVACFIPTGADPAKYLEAASAGGDGPPQVEGGPPHFTKGMRAELTVTSGDKRTGAAAG